MDAPDRTSSPPPSQAVLLAHMVGAAMAMRIGARKPAARVSLAVVGVGRWTFAASAPTAGRPGWDDAAELQVLCEEAVLASLLTGAAVTPGQLLLVSGEASVVDGIGSLFDAGGSPLAVRLGWEKRMSTINTFNTFKGLRSLPEALAQQPVTPAQQEKIRAAAAVLVQPLEVGDVNTEALARLGIPSHLFPHVVFELFLAQYPMLRRDNVDRNMAQLARSIAEAPALSPGAEALKVFDQAMASPPRTGALQLKGDYAVQQVVVDESANLRVRLPDSAYLGHQDVDIIRDARTQSVVLRVRGSAKPAALHDVNDAGLKKLIAAVTAWLSADAVNVARGNPENPHAAAVRDTLLPRLQESLSERRLAALEQQVASQLPTDVTSAIAAATDGQMAARVPPGFLAALVTRIFG